MNSYDFRTPDFVPIYKCAADNSHVADNSHIAETSW